MIRLAHLLDAKGLEPNFTVVALASVRRARPLLIVGQSSMLSFQNENKGRYHLPLG